MPHTPETLILLPMLRATRLPGGKVGLTKKFVDGVLEFQEHWGGPVHLLMEPTDEEGHNLDNVEIDPADAPYGIELLAFQSSDLPRHLAGAGMVLGGTSHRQNHLADVCASVGVPCVYGTEYTLRTRMQITKSDVTNPVVRARRYLWHWNQERRQRSALKRASGVQCNGTPTFEAYETVSPSPMLYFDTRVRESMLASADALDAKLATLRDERPLHIAFSGRLDPMKGAHYLARIARELKKRQVPFKMSICGAGSLVDSMKADIQAWDLGDCVEMKGVLDFERELVPFIRDEVDLFLCTHLQGDPSCTYLETASCGVPILGFDNEAWAGILRREDIGWSIPMHGTLAAAETIARLDSDRNEIARAARKSLNFAKEHTFEATVGRRMAHLKELIR